MTPMLGIMASQISGHLGVPFNADYLIVAGGGGGEENDSGGGGAGGYRSFTTQSLLM